nr:immunoglobulin heavy chain junction region [Macaca mulatta]
CCFGIVYGFDSW